MIRRGLKPHGSVPEVAAGVFRGRASSGPESLRPTQGAPPEGRRNPTMWPFGKLPRGPSRRRAREQTNRVRGRSRVVTPGAGNVERDSVERRVLEVVEGVVAELGGLREKG